MNSQEAQIKSEQIVKELYENGMLKQLGGLNKVLKVDRVFFCIPDVVEMVSIIYMQLIGKKGDEKWSRMIK